MIQIRNKVGSVVPGVLAAKGVVERDKLNDEYTSGKRVFSFDKDIYGDEEVKAALIRLQGYKCCFCEAKIGHIDDGDIEHFRPKAGWVQDEEPINKPGYYWLAYEWDNLFLACTKCNQRNKKNYFPLITPETRAKNHIEDYKNEDPVFIHPANDNPENYIEFNEEIPEPVNNDLRGRVTIKKLGLDRTPLNEDRRREFNKIFDIYDLAKSYPPTPPDLKRRARNKLLKYYAAAQQDETEYASMLRCFFRKNPIDF